MRQGGLSPKGHNSGVYWTRAASKRGTAKPKKEQEPKEVFNPNDLDHDGIVTPTEAKIVLGIHIVTWALAFVFVGFLTYLAKLGLKS
jgi:hypothetical protein